MSQTTFEVTERGFDFLCPKIKRYSTLQVSIVEERNVPIIKKDLWGINETIAFKKYFMVNLTGLNDLDEKTKQRIQLYIDGSQGEEWNDDQDELNQKHIKTETLLKYVVLAYIAQGKFVANNKSDLDNQPTIDTADIVTSITKDLTTNEDKTIVKDIFKYGKTPVIYGPSRSMLKPPATPGLGHMISQATTTTEVANLISNGIKNYKNASVGTIRSWENIAQKRIAQLTK